MSATLRAALAVAVDEVLGPKRCSPYFRQSARPGDAWVSLARLDRDDTGFGYMAGWEVRVALAQDLAAAERWVDEHLDDVVEAVERHLVVTAAVMVTFVMDGGNVPGLAIEGVAPHEKEDTP